MSTSDKIKEELLLIVFAIIHGLYVLVTFILPSVVITMLLIPDVANKIVEDPKILALPLVNAVVAALVAYLQPKLQKTNG